MITNDRQYKITKDQILKFQDSLAVLEYDKKLGKDIDPILFDLQVKAIKIQLDELLNQVEEYDNLKAGKIAITEIDNLKSLPVSLIKARIANGLTQAQLANKVGLKMQQIQRYEAEVYETASIKTLTKIAEALNITLSAEVQIKNVDAPETLDIKNYPFKQMFQRKWFGNFSGTYNDAVVDSKNLLEKFFESIGLNKIHYGFTKVSIRAEASVNRLALKAWYTRVIAKASLQSVPNVYTQDTISETWLKRLAELSIDPEGPLKAAEYLKHSGIKFVVEPHLEGTYLDGAALKWENDAPIIAITMRYDRLDNFWFVLFHELAHVRLHLSDDLTIIFDDLDVKIDGIEKEADSFALNALIADETWRKSLARFSPSKDTIVKQAKILHVHPALVAGRIRKETGEYSLYSDLVGQGQVRSLFFDELNF